MRTSRSARALALSQQIAALSAELDQLLRLDSSDRSVSPPPRSGPITVGDLVVITNRYGGHLGKRAKVIGSVGQSFELRLTSTGETLQKRKRNVCRLL